MTRDTNVVDGVARRALGGTVLFAARTYAALGIDCCVVTRAAPEDRGEIGAAFPSTTEIVLLPSSATTTFENEYAVDGTRTQRAPALAAPVPLNPAWLTGLDVIHLGPLHARDLEGAWFEVVAAPLALDLQGPTRRVADGRVRPALTPRLGDRLARFRWLKGSAREWALVREGCRELRFGEGAERLLTRGIDGGEVAIGSVCHRWQAAPPVRRCDPTGAGDVYFAAYLASRLQGRAPGDAAERAARFTSAFLAERD